MRQRGSYTPGDPGERGPNLPPQGFIESHPHALTIALIIGATVAQRAAVARRVHRESPLRAGHFVGVHCGKELDQLRTALRAWTVAGNLTPTGRYQEAEEGTLYLDGVEDLPLDTQPYLLALARRLQGGPDDAPGWPCVGQLVVGNHRPLILAVSAGRFDPVLHEVLDKVRIELGPGVAASGSP